MWIHLPSFCSSNYSVCLSVSSTCVHRCVHVCVYLLPAVGVDSSRCTCFPFPLTGTALLWYYSPGLIATLKSAYVLICLLHLPVCLLIVLRGKPTCLTHYLELSVGNLTTLGSGNWKLALGGKLKDLPESKLLHTEFMFWCSEKILVNIHYCCKLLNLFTEFFRSTCSCVILLNLSGESGIVNFTKTRNIWCYYILL